MDRSKIVYRDVTGNESVSSRAHYAPAMRDALVTLGFERVGVLEARLGGSLTAEPLGQIRADTDAELVLQMIAEGEVVEILTSPDRTTFAAIERWFGGPLVCLYTLVEEGIVVETTMKPADPPKPNGVAAGGLSLREDDPAGRVATLLINAAVGTPPLWIHKHWPRSGYRLALVDTREVEVLWHEHRRRIDQMARREGVCIRPHSTLPLYLCIRHSARRIARQKDRWQEWFNRGITLLFFALVVTTVLSTGQIFARLSSLGSLALFVPLVLMALAGSLAALFIGFIRETVVPQLPGPKLQPVRHLLAEVEAAYRLGAG
jgi:hypothetical protein